MQSINNNSRLPLSRIGFFIKHIIRGEKTVMERVIVYECESDYHLLSVLNLCIVNSGKSRSIILVRKCFRGAENKSELINRSLREYGVTSYSFDNFSENSASAGNSRIKNYIYLIKDTFSSKTKCKAFLDRIGLTKADEFWCGNFSGESKVLCTLLKERNKSLQVTLYEEGISFYGDMEEAVDVKPSVMHDLYLKIFGMRDISKEIEKAYCYRPDEVMWKGVYELCKLPEITESRLRHLNDIFSYDPGIADKYEDSIIYMNQPFMDDGVELDDRFLVDELHKQFGDRLKVKLHPRAKDLMYGEDIEYIKDETMWEVVCGNAAFNNTVLVTVSSQSVLTPFLLYGKNVKAVCLYKIFNEVGSIPGMQYIQNQIEPKNLEFLHFPRDIAEAKDVLCSV